MMLGMLSSALTGWLEFAVVFGMLVLLLTLAISMRSWRRHDGRFGLPNVLVVVLLVITLGELMVQLAIDMGHEPGWLRQAGSVVFVVIGVVLFCMCVVLVAYSFRSRQRL